MAVTLKVSEDEPVKLTPEEQEEATLKVAELLIFNQNTDYRKLDNKPQINSVELIDNKSFEDLGLHRITNSDIERILQT